MLQQPPHLSRVCGHSHFKKVWLLQTQRENQSCENISNRVAADGKHSPLSSGSPSNRTSVTGASPTGLLVRPLVACTGAYNGPSFSGRQTSLITCAESLSLTPLRLDHSYPSSRPSSPNVSSDGRKDEDAGPDLNVFKAPLRSGSLSPSSSRCGSPPVLRDSHCLNSDHGEDERTSVKAGNTVSSCSYSSDRELSSSHEDSLCNVASPTERRNLTKSSQNLQIDSRSLTTDNSDASSEQINTSAARDSSHESGGHNPNSAVLNQYATLSSREKRSWLFVRKTYDNGSISNVPHSSIGPAGRSKVDLNDDSIATKSEVSCADVNLARNTSVIRTCSLCGTTKTPLWRSGPHGPKSLCNACGIRFKKAKRNSGQSDGHEIPSSPVASPGTDKAMPRPLKRKQEMLSGIDAEWNRGCSTHLAVTEATHQEQKRSMWSKAKVRNVTVSHVRDSLSHKDLARTGRDSWLTWNLQSPSIVPGASPRSEMSRPVTPEKQALNRVIGKDDEEAAFLLMYLSSGLIYA